MSEALVRAKVAQLVPLAMAWLVAGAFVDVRAATDATILFVVTFDLCQWGRA